MGWEQFSLCCANQHILNNRTAHVSTRQGRVTSSTQTLCPTLHSKRESSMALALLVTCARRAPRLAPSLACSPKCVRETPARGTALPTQSALRCDAHAWSHLARSVAAFGSTPAHSDPLRDPAAAGRTPHLAAAGKEKPGRPR